MENTLKSKLLRVKVNVNPSRSRLAAITILFIGILCLPSRSEAFCFEEAGKIYGVSPQLLWSIAKAESDFNPRAINFRSDTDYDFGLMQIHTSWAKKLGEDVWQSLGDPCQSVKVGAWILAQCIRQHGLNWKGIGCYNAISEDKQKIYAKKVISILNQVNQPKLERN